MNKRFPEKKSEKESGHTPVLFTESIDALNINPKGIYVDGTLGGAGHAEAIVEKLGKQGTFIGIDVDIDAIKRAQTRLESYPCHKYFMHDNFRNLDSILSKVDIKSVSGILLDLGWSSFQINDASRGLSFVNDGPLDMNLSKGLDTERVTAHEIINSWEESTLADIFYGYGDEVKARVIARHIVSVRKAQPITTTHQLAQVVIEALFPKKVATNKDAYFKIHPATKVFQALRIAVNDELQTVTDTIHVGIEKLATGGRFAIITFHSGEDRIVKHLFKSYVDQGIIQLVTKKPISPTDEEVRANPRARSSKLRIIEKI
jgi:16S rRNA (cytosine1402-N4)-methyltransferase